MAKSSGSTVNKRSYSGLVFVGCMFLGIGIGGLMNQTGPGTLIGMGVGFIGMGVVNYKLK